MTTHIIRDRFADGEPVGTITDTDPTDDEPGSFVIAQDDRPAIDIWTPDPRPGRRPPVDPRPGLHRRGDVMLFPLHPGPLNPAVGVINGWAITSYFGGRIDPLTGRAGTHGGMDLAYYGCAGQPMIAVADGTVAQGWDNSGGGNWSGLTTANGDYFGYGHAQRFELGPGVHQVKAGDVIAYVGTSGGSTGPHLHFAYRPAGASGYRDPYDLLVAAAAGDQPPQEDDVTPEQMQELMDRIDASGAATRDFLSERLEQVAAADRAKMGILAESIIDAVVRADADDATEEQVTRKRDELLAVIRPQLDRIEAG